MRPLARHAAAAAIAAAAVLLPAAPALAEPGDELTVSVLTMGPGDHPFFKFGHNAILVQDRLKRQERVYNFGTFSFDSPSLIFDFLKGRLSYWLSVSSMRGTIEIYRRENRTLFTQELNLTPAQRREVVDALEENALPANKYYKYDYYRDNCSTRVRDVVDKVARGAVKAASADPASQTWRQHTLRLTADDVPFYYALHIVMGNLIDRRVTTWEEMFLPSVLQQTLRKATIPGPDGAPIPLVKEERQLLNAKRDPLRESAPTRAPYTLLFGAALGGLLAYLGRNAAQKAHRIALGAILAPLGLLFGFFGTFFTVVWFFTDHEVSHHNENILQCGPWLLVLAGSGIGLALGKARSAARAASLTRASVIASAAGLALKALFFWFNQDNWQFIVMLLPLWAGAAYGTREAARILAPSPPASPPPATPDEPARAEGAATG